jgi:quinol monooxygenase YgiN
MIAVTSELKSRSGREAEVLRIALALARRACEDEPGCHGYTVARSKHDPRRFLTFERYEDDAALAEHSRAPHFKQAFEQLMERLEEPPRVAIFDVVTD